MFGIGLPELLVIFFVCLLLFGAARLPDIGRSLGEGIREFKRAVREGQENEPKPKEGPPVIDVASGAKKLDQ